MRKVLVGMVALVSAVGGVAACGNNDKAKASAGQTAGVPVGTEVRKIVDFKSVAGSAPSVVKGPDVALEPAARFTLVLGEGKGGFKFRSKALSDDAKAKIDEMFAGEKFDMKGARFEIEGYTDNLGSKKVNDEMGLARAKAVKAYLVECHEIPAETIKVISYGMEKPVADNATPEGRAKNRRVVIKVVD